MAIRHLSGPPLRIRRIWALFPACMHGTHGMLTACYANRHEDFHTPLVPQPGIILVPKARCTRCPQAPSPGGCSPPQPQGGQPGVTHLLWVLPYLLPHAPSCHRKRSQAREDQQGAVPTTTQGVTAVETPHFEMQRDMLRGTRVWPSSCKTSTGNAGDNPAKRKLSTPKPRSLSARASREGARANNEHRPASGPPRHASTLPKALKKQVQCGGLEIRAIGAQRKTTLPENQEGPSPRTLRPDSEGASAARLPPVPRLRRSVRIAGRKKKIHVLCAQCGLSGLETRVHPKVTNARVRRRAAGVREDCQASSVASAQEPNTLERGMLVWFKFQDHPFWPAVVKSVNKNDKMARVLLIEGNMQFERRGVRVPLRKLKLLDCGEKFSLLRRAGKVYGQGINWCLSVIDHYREDLACGSFRGSFLDYYSARASYPLRRAIQEGDLRIDFPKVSYGDLEDWEEETALGGKGPHKKLLPDRMRAAWDRANQKLVDFIVKRKGADQHLLDIVKGKKPSRWLDDLWKSKREVFCIETYLEDEDQLHLVARHLQEISKEADQALLSLARGDQVRLTMEVLLPEAIVCSIAALDELGCLTMQIVYIDSAIPVSFQPGLALFGLCPSVQKSRGEASLERPQLVFK